MDLQAAEVAFTEPGLINRVDVVVKRDDDVGRVAGAIAAILPRVSKRRPTSAAQGGSARSDAIPPSRLGGGGPARTGGSIPHRLQPSRHRLRRACLATRCHACRRGAVKAGVARTTERSPPARLRWRRSSESHSGVGLDRLLPTSGRDDDRAASSRLTAPDAEFTLQASSFALAAALGFVTAVPRRPAPLGGRRT